MSVTVLRGVLAVCAMVTARSLPFLNMGDFSWAENLLITHDGLNMFVSDNTRGELYRITLLADQEENYVRSTHLSGQELKAFGGLAQSADGKLVYAGVTFSDKTTAIITTDSDTKNGEYNILFQTTYQPNGLQIDLTNNMMYYTDTASGSLMAIDMVNTKEYLVDTLENANGLWLDSNNDLLYVGELMPKHVNVFNTSSGNVSLLKKYSGLSSLSRGHMLDDLTLYGSSDLNALENTMVLGADYQGKAVQQFSLNGDQISEVKVSDQVLSDGQLHEITSVRWGVGPNFDENSVYVSEGGGMTSRDKSRRVFQIIMK